MKYIVVVDAECPVGQMYAHKLPRFRGNEAMHPGFVCSDVDFTSVHYLRLEVDGDASRGLASQTIHLPHRDVLLVVEADQQDRPPAGFLP